MGNGERPSYPVPLSFLNANNWDFEPGHLSTCFDTFNKSFLLDGRQCRSFFFIALITTQKGDDLIMDLNVVCLPVWIWMFIRNLWLQAFVLLPRHPRSYLYCSDFFANNFDIVMLRGWLIEHDCEDVCMESTSKYWIPILNILETHMHVIFTHLQYVKAIKGKKQINGMPSGLLIFPF